MEKVITDAATGLLPPRSERQVLVDPKGDYRKYRGAYL
jgi:hypothetical protein